MVTASAHGADAVRAAHANSAGHQAQSANGGRGSREHADKRDPRCVLGSGVGRCDVGQAGALAPIAAAKVLIAMADRPRLPGSRRRTTTTAVVWLATAVILGVASAVALAVFNRPADRDMSIACGQAWFPRCFSGVTVDDFERPLIDLGYDCQRAFGVEHSNIRCSPPGPAGSPISGLDVRIELAGRLVSLVVAQACGAVPDDQVLAAFVAYARVPFPSDPTRALRAVSWIEASRDGREHHVTMAGYLFTLQRSGCERLGIRA
jgi:hypothetical protein